MNSLDTVKIVLKNVRDSAQLLQTRSLPLKLSFNLLRQKVQKERVIVRDRRRSISDGTLRMPSVVTEKCRRTCVAPATNLLRPNQNVTVLHEPNALSRSPKRPVERRAGK